MCGIAGHMGPAKGASDLRQTAMAMADSIKYRGPDDSGVWADEGAGIALAHRRLAILDLSSAGHQPMNSGSGRWLTVFNGEIYNHLALRKQLETSGHVVAWRGHSDTETFLACVEKWGVESAIKAAVGMFALALWDQENRILTLARDRLGEKPLYYGWMGETFLFGSELKALRAHPAFGAEIDRDALAVFMRYGYVSAPRSIYRGVQKLPPGTLLTVRHGHRAEPKPRPYWSLLDVAQRGVKTPFGGSDADATKELGRRLSEAVAIQQIADVPLGVFLSGGIDSSTIVALMQTQSNRPVHSFTVGFNDGEYNEAVHARAVARHLGTDHTELYITPEEAVAVIPQLPALYDEPFGDSSQIPTFLVSQLARRSVTVSLSGDGGDELFGGYNRYIWTRKLLRYPAPLRRMLAGALTTLSPSCWDSIYAAVEYLLPAPLRMRMAGDKAHKLASVLSADSNAEVYQGLISTWPNPDALVFGSRDAASLSAAWDKLINFSAPESRMMALDTLTFLPDDILCKVDRAAMAVSLETRVPLLDHRVVEFAWSLPLNMKIRNGQGKWLLRQLLYKYVPKKLIDRPKMGFAVPLDAWLRGALREWAEGLLEESRLRREGYFNPLPIRQKWAEHLSGKRNWQYQLWHVLMFEAWLAAHG
jgi:asparagine synthase (glutamine-hydrolysing)